MKTAEELPNVEKHYRKHINNANGVIEYVSLQFDTEAKMMEWLEHYHQQKLAEEKSCNHEFDDPVYNQGEELMGYACSKCGKIEYI